MTTKKPIRLYWGENYSDKPKAVMQAIDKAYKHTLNQINLYPGVLYDEVVLMVGKANSLQPEQILLGHGIEGLIHLATVSLLSKGEKGGMFKPSFYVFEDNLKRYEYVKIGCDYRQKVDVDKLIKDIQGTKVFFLASPNTGTGNYLLNEKEIKKVLKNYEGILIVDECYFGLGSQTVIDLVSEHDNLLVFRGVTKVMGFGGLRIAFAAGDKKIIERLKQNSRELELDPLPTFSLAVFKEVFPYFNELSSKSRTFFNNFVEYMRKEFPNDKIVQTVITYEFMDLSRYNKHTFEVMNYLTKHGYVMSENFLTNDTVLNFPNILELTPPPKEYWEDFVSTLKEALR